jgi:hypothetical protein
VDYGDRKLSKQGNRASRVSIKVRKKSYKKMIRIIKELSLPDKWRDPRDGIIDDRQGRFFSIK